jgi:hypothetical protein
MDVVDRETPVTPDEQEGNTATELQSVDYNTGAADDDSHGDWMGNKMDISKRLRLTPGPKLGE